MVDKTSNVAHQFISNMVANSKQFGTRGDLSNKRVNEVSISNLENKVNDLTSLVRSLACGNVQQAKVCIICSLQGHASDMCPTMQEDYIEQANAVDGTFNGQPQRKYDPFSNTYNPRWSKEVAANTKENTNIPPPNPKSCVLPSFYLVVQ